MAKARRSRQAKPDNCLAPQPGPQTEFVRSTAEIVIYGGQAGGGKSWAMLIDPLRYVATPGFTAVIFRRSIPELTMPGGLWRQAQSIYSQIGAEFNLSSRSASWPNGGSISFTHLQYDDTRYDYQGAEIAYLGFDELTQFSSEQFWYMLSRNRSTCGVYPRVRATTNPDADSWVRPMIAWWIDDKTGLAIPDRSGVIRWLVRDGRDGMRQFATEAEAKAYADPLGLGVKSLTFIHATLADNPILRAKDPGYEQNLRSQDYVERERLLHGNWNIRHEAGNVFKASWFRKVAAAPAGLRKVRYWDLAATEGGGDYTVGALMGIDAKGYSYILNVHRGQWSPAGVEREIRQTAEHDGRDVEVWIEQEGGSAGKIASSSIIRGLQGWDVRADRKTGSKLDAAKPVSAQAEAGNIFIVDGPWVRELLNELESFDGSGKRHDDQVDAVSGAFAKLHVERATFATI